jgi:hypothetical protein
MMRKTATNGRRRKLKANMPLPSDTVVFPIWKGRRGLVNAVICSILGLACAIGLLKFAERTVVVPKCTAYGQSRGMTYSGNALYTSMRYGAGKCIFKTKNGGVEDVSFEDATSLFTGLWLGLAFQLDLTIPTFILLLALLRSIPYFRASQR